MGIPVLALIHPETVLLGWLGVEFPLQPVVSLGLVVSPWAVRKVVGGPPLNLSPRLRVRPERVVPELWGRLPGHQFEQDRLVGDVLAL